MRTVKYERIPFYVDVADQVTEENMEELAEWCKGEIRTEGSGPGARRYIKVHVHQPLKERQTKAFAGDLILYAGNGFKVYTQKAFEKSFRKVKHLSRAEAQRAGIKPPLERRANGKTPVAKGTPNPKSFAQQQKVKVQQKNSDVTATVPLSELKTTPNGLDSETIAQQQAAYAASIDERDQKTAEEMLSELLEETN